MVFKCICLRLVIRMLMHYDYSQFYSIIDCLKFGAVFHCDLLFLYTIIKSDI